MSIGNVRSHKIQIDEWQVSYIKQGLQALLEKVPGLDVDNEIKKGIHHDVKELELMFKSLLDIPVADYDRNMLHGFTL